MVFRVMNSTAPFHLFERGWVASLIFLKFNSSLLKAMVGLEDDPFLLGQMVTFQGRTRGLNGSNGPTTKELLLSLAFAGEESRGLALGQKCCLSDKGALFKRTKVLIIDH